MSQIALEPTTSRPGAGGRWMTVIFDDDVTPVEVVLVTLVAATGCDMQEAAMEVWEAEAFGRAAVHFGSEEECRQAAAVIARAKIVVEVQPEWND